MAIQRVVPNDGLEVLPKPDICAASISALSKLTIGGKEEDQRRLRY